MRIHTTLAAAALLLVSTAAIAAETGDSVGVRLPEPNAIFADYWETNLRLNPTLATNVGDKA